MPFDTSPEKYAANYRAILAGMQESKNNIISVFLDIKEYPLELTDECSNQILVVYRTGRFEVMPKGVHGAAIRDYLGIAYHRITKWTALPSAWSKDNPSKIKTGVGTGSVDKDIYEHRTN